MYIYILTNETKSVLYIGVTRNLEQRIWKHKNKYYKSSFTKEYNVSKLVYFEESNDNFSAIKREKQLKKWKREWKINLIEKTNPLWLDFSEGW